MSVSALLVTLYYAAVPLLVVGISWVVIRRDYGGGQPAQGTDAEGVDTQAGVR